MLTSRITDARHAFDTQNRRAQDMDMGELTREEVAARIEAVEARIEARAQVTDSKIDTLGNEMKAEMRALAQATDSKITALAQATDSKITALAQATDSKIDLLRIELEMLRTQMEARAHATDSKIEALDYKIDSKVDKGFADIIKWMVGAAIAMMAIAVTVIIFMINTAVSRQVRFGVPAPAVSAPAPPR
jgi:hypothetical protein